MMQVDVLVAGAGFSGAVTARRLADAGLRVHVVEKRDHVGGNAHDRLDAHGVLVHPYGPHIFHTNAARVVEYLSAFTEWRPYEHRVLAQVEHKLLPIPINIDTVNGLYGLCLDEDTIQAFYDAVREARSPIRNSEDVVVNAVGRDLYEKFFRNYTRKHWGLDPSKLAASVTSRVPTRTNRDDRYFTDTFQQMPRDGYTPMFQRMLDSPLISVELGADYFARRADIQARHTVYTGPIDTFFGHIHGPAALPLRALRA
jgi:UDP-galactopyranose mutase